VPSATECPEGLQIGTLEKGPPGRSQSYSPWLWPSGVSDHSISTMESRGNPALLQQGDPSCTPLFLIHDSSGGVFNYFKLELLGRPVYTIYNPWFRNTEKWNGGTMLFVRKYIELIKTIVRRGDILVGGPSINPSLSSHSCI
jgi:hypothetical protein